MRSERLQDAIGEVRDDFIQDAGIVLKKKEHTWIKWGALAACICLLAISAMKLLGSHPVHSDVRSWSASMTAEDYFRNSKNVKSQKEHSTSTCLVMMPYALSVSMDNERSKLEENGILPLMPSHLDQHFQAEYNGDGSLYKLSFMWMRRSEQGLDDYSDLTLIAAPKEIHEISDVIAVRTDEKGHILPAEMTQTVRDGITIVAEGREDEQKTLTWQTDQGWYQIIGSWNDSYDDMVSLLDWFWDHPLSLSPFETPPNETFLFSTYAEQANAFSGQIPDFSALGYRAESERVNTGLCDGKWRPIWFEGLYQRGDTRIVWTINTGADAESWAACLGRPNEVSEEKVREALSQKNTFNLFFDTPSMATLVLEEGTSTDAWEIIQTLQN